MSAHDPSRGQTIVVGVDSSPTSDAALDWARRFAGVRDHIIAVRAWNVPLFVSPYVPQAIFPRDFEAIASKALKASVGDIDDDRVHPVLRQGRPGAVVVAEAAEADLTVVGHRGEGRMSMVLGSTATYVLHHSQGPVVVVRGDRVPSFAHIVVGVDGPVEADPDDSVDASVRALRWAYGVPGARRITVVHAWFLPPVETGIAGRVPLAMEEWDAAASAVVTAAIEAAGDPPADVSVEPAVIRAPAGRALVRQSETADLVVVGSRGRGGFAGLLLGSTSGEVAAHGHSPVVVVR